MTTTLSSKFKRVFFNLIGICLVYAVCMFYGKAADRAAYPISLKFHEVIAEAAIAHDIHPALI
nr:hypothetical protein [bacterium]